MGKIQSEHRSLRRMKYWELIAEGISKVRWSWGYVSAVDCEGRTIWIADAHSDGKRFIVRSEEKLTAFLELELASRYPGFNDAGVAENTAPVREGYD